MIQYQYTPVKEITDTYNLEGNETVVIKNIKMNPKKFTNTVTNDTVTNIHHLDYTGFHFYNSVAFQSEQKGVIVGGAGLRIRTTKDGGLHWQENQFSKFANTLHSVFVKNEKIYAVGASEYIYRSSDFGKTWQAYNTNILINKYLSNTVKENKYSPRYYKIKFYNKTGVIVGDYDKTTKAKPILLKTIDNGNTWTVIKTNTIKSDDKGISDIIMLSERVFIIVTLKGTCYKSIDGGNHWKLLFKNDKISLNAIDFINEEEGYIGGMNSTLLHTNNGGKTWETIDIGLGKYLNITNVKFIDNQRATITIASQNGEFKVDFLYEIDTKTKVIKSLLSKKDTTVTFKGEAYGLYRLKNRLYVLDRNNLYFIKIQ